MLDRLEGADRLAELLAQAGIGDGEVAGRFGDTEQLRGDEQVGRGKHARIVASRDDARVAGHARDGQRAAEARLGLRMRDLDEGEAAILEEQRHLRIRGIEKQDVAAAGDGEAGLALQPGEGGG